MACVIALPCKNLVTVLDMFVHVYYHEIMNTFQIQKNYFRSDSC